MCVTIFVFVVMRRHYVRLARKYGRAEQFVCHVVGRYRTEAPGGSCQLRRVNIPLRSLGFRFPIQFAGSLEGHSPAACGVNVGNSLTLGQVGRKQFSRGFRERSPRNYACQQSVLCLRPIICPIRGFGGCAGECGRRDPVQQKTNTRRGLDSNERVSWYLECVCVCARFSDCTSPVCPVPCAVPSCVV